MSKMRGGTGLGQVAAAMWLVFSVGCAAGSPSPDGGGPRGTDAGPCPGQTVCGPGLCADLMVDDLHCGICGNACRAGATCVDGECYTPCAAEETECPSGCRDTMTDNRNCGACGTICEAGEICELGACVPDCAPELTLCGGVCVDVLEDDVNCGTCGVTCDFPAESCLDGVCCAPGLIGCDGVCADLLTDTANCGACGVACMGADVCAAGVCSPPWAGIRTFTNCAGTTATGPAQTACDAEYTGTLAGEVTVTAGIQRWVVPIDGTFQIEAFGAEGASAQTGQTGGDGARMRGDFVLTAGQVLDVLVGQEGTQDGCNGGGGGGSFVVDVATGSPLLVAGGGAGTRTSVMQDGCDGRASEEGGTGSASGATHTCAARSGGIGLGGIVSGSSWGSAGGGMTTDGASDGTAGRGGRAYANGAQGGTGTATGGFGTGGAGNGSCGGGGGGGYSGGDGGRVAGGGGSFNSGANPSNMAGARTGHGMVTIDRL